MKGIERFELIDRIGRELQSRMSYSDIDAYLTQFGIDPSTPTSGVNSKWVYSKELLASAPEHTLLKIADELEIPHAHVMISNSEVTRATFWAASHFRLFLSHLAQFKKTAAGLQKALRPYGISAFVAHVDIEPTREWQDEIEAGLLSMDALAAILMPGFKDSNWTDQEVGAAVGRGLLIVPIIKGLDPYGFIAKYQGLQTSDKTIGQVAHDVFQTIVTSEKTRTRILTCLVDTIVQCQEHTEVVDKLAHLASVDALPKAYLERLRDGAEGSPLLAAEKPLAKLNQLLESRGLQRLVSRPQGPSTIDDDLPF